MCSQCKLTWAQTSVQVLQTPCKLSPKASLVVRFGRLALEHGLERGDGALLLGVHAVHRVPLQVQAGAAARQLRARAARPSPLLAQQQVVGVGRAVKRRQSPDRRRRAAPVAHLARRTGAAAWVVVRQQTGHIGKAVFQNPGFKGWKQTDRLMVKRFTNASLNLRFNEF